MAREMSPALTSCSHVRRRISRRRGDASAVKTVVSTSMSYILVITKIMSSTNGHESISRIFEISSGGRPHVKEAPLSLADPSDARVKPQIRTENVCSVAAPVGGVDSLQPFSIFGVADDHQLGGTRAVKKSRGSRFAGSHLAREVLNHPSFTPRKACSLHEFAYAPGRQVALPILDQRGGEIVIDPPLIRSVMRVEANGQHAATEAQNAPRLDKESSRIGE